MARERTRAQKDRANGAARIKRARGAKIDPAVRAMERGLKLQEKIRQAAARANRRAAFLAWFGPLEEAIRGRRIELRDRPTLKQIRYLDKLLEWNGIGFRTRGLNYDALTRKEASGLIDALKNEEPEGVRKVLRAVHRYVPSPEGSDLPRGVQALIKMGLWPLPEEPKVKAERWEPDAEAIEFYKLLAA